MVLSTEQQGGGAASAASAETLEAPVEPDDRLQGQIQLSDRQRQEMAMAVHFQGQSTTNVTLALAQQQSKHKLASTIHITTAATPANGSSSQMRVTNGRQSRPLSPTIVPDAGQLVHGNINAVVVADATPESALLARKSKNKGHAFIYRWFHSTSQNLAASLPQQEFHAIKLDAEHKVRHATVCSQESANERQSVKSQGSDVQSSKPSETLIHRLLHPAVKQHVPVPADDASSSKSQLDEACDQPGVGVHPPRASDSPQTRRRNMLIAKLVHSATAAIHGDADHCTASNGQHTLGNLFGLKHKHDPRSSVSAVGDEGVHSSHVSPRSSIDSLNHVSPASSQAHKSSDSNNVSTGTSEQMKTNDSEHKLHPRGMTPSISNVHVKDVKDTDSVMTSGRRSLNHMFKSMLMPPKMSASGSVTSQDSHPSSHESILSEKYGQAERIIGKGAGGTVRLFHKLGFIGPGDKLYAVKEFRKKRKNETDRDYIKKLTSEFCISSNLHHLNVVETIDLVQDDKQRWCEIMEYCPGGDLFEIVRNGKMTMLEINCCFKQLINGVDYLHSMGVAHRYIIDTKFLQFKRCSDLKPENLLLDAHGQLKITDFGVSDVFRTCWEKEAHKSKGLCGSEPYIAPEEFCGDPYDARKVDIWSSGIVYYAMLFHGVPWRQATFRDLNYARYMENRSHFEPFMRLPPALAHLIERVLEPDPMQRITIADLKDDVYFKSIDSCEDCVDRRGKYHNHFTFAYSQSAANSQQNSPQQKARRSAAHEVFQSATSSQILGRQQSTPSSFQLNSSQFESSAHFAASSVAVVTDK